MLTPSPRRPCMVFDLLHQDGRELTGRPLRDRRARLESVAAGSEFVLPVRRLARNGFEAWSEVIAHDYEGLVAKEEPEPVRGRADAAVVEGQAEGMEPALKGRRRHVVPTIDHSDAVRTQWQPDADPFHCLNWAKGGCCLRDTELGSNPGAK